MEAANDTDSSDESYVMSSDNDESFMPQKRKRAANTSIASLSEVPCFLSLMSLREVNGKAVGRLKRTLQDCHPFLKRPEVEFQTEWCDIMKRFYLTDEFHDTLYGEDAEKKPEDVREEEPPQYTVTHHVDFSRFGGKPKYIRADEAQAETEQVIASNENVSESQLTTTAAALKTWKSHKAANPEMVDELAEHHKGKNVYLEQQSFLGAVDSKHYALRKQMERGG